jgi:pimeloyl-ACP methyl ester carboxylesterase
VLNLGSNPVVGIAGSAPLADIVDLTEGDVFLGIPGSLDSTTGIAQLSVPIMAVQNAQSITVGQTNINPARFAAPPAPYGGRIWNPTRGWLDFTEGFVPSKKTLILVHGVNSSVEAAYGGCINELMAAGGYEQAVGFDYDWTQRPADTGASFAEFLNQLQARGLSQADIEAHSFGTITALAAMAHTNLTIPHAILLGGPLDGTPLAQSPAMVTWISYNMNGLSTTSIRTLDEFLGSGVLADLSPGSGVLNAMTTSAIGAHHETSFVRVVGQTCLEIPPLAQRYVFGFNIDATNDCFIPVTSAAGSGLPGPTALYFDQQHDKLECDPTVIHNVGILVRQPIPTPTPTSAPSIMVSPATLSFSATEGGFAPPNQSFTIKNVGAPGSTLNYAVTKDASWTGLSGPIIPLASGESATFAVSANPSGLRGANSPYTATITVSDPASTNLSQNVTVTFTITAPPSPTPSPTPAGTPTPTPSGNKYCINEWHWIYPPGDWDTSKWYGSNTLGQYPYPGSPQCNVYPYKGCVVTYTYDCDSDALPQPCGAPICVP